MNLIHDDAVADWPCRHFGQSHVGRSDKQHINEQLAQPIEVDTQASFKTKSACAMMQGQSDR